MNNSYAKFFSAIALVAGTTIGAGMLGLPILTGLTGFLPSIFSNLLCWFLFLCTGLLFFEICLLMPEHSNYSSITEHFFGRPGKYAFNLLYVFLYYCLLVSYIGKGATLFTKFIVSFVPLNFSVFFSSLIFSVLIALICFVGTHFLSRVNFFFFLGLIAAFFCLLGVAYPHAKLENLAYQNYSFFFLGLPILYSSYGFHNIIPSLTTYLKKDRKTLQRAIIIGTIIPLIFYLLWQALVLSLVSREQLFSALSRGKDASSILKYLLDSKLFFISVSFFAFFALTTSIFGVTLSMLDFLFDALRPKRNKKNKALLLLSIFIPVILINTTYPKAFLNALRLAGGLGEALLNGALPIALAWSARYVRKLNHERILFGGKPLLFLLMSFSLLVFFLEVKHLISMIKGAA